MQRIIQCTSVIFILIMMIVSCSKKKPTESTGSLETCGGGKGYPVEFCRQVGNYEYGYGEPGQDTIIVNCIVGPEGATVSNTKNGTYYCAGTYILTTYSSAVISLNWGGTTNYTMYEEHTISSSGEGSFSVKVTKSSGGSGNIFLSMSSGSSWMFDIVLVNVECDGGSLKPGLIQTDQSTSLEQSESFIEKKVPREYYCYD